jgi:hypothetical protein
MSEIRRPVVPAGRPVAREALRRSGAVVVSAWAVPVLVLGEFAMLAVVPVVVLTVAVLRDARLRALRWWVLAAAAVYASGLVAWAVGPERAPSLSKDLHPLHAAVIAAVSVAVAVRYHVARRHPRRPR